jgi:hypothetical protein
VPIIWNVEETTHNRLWWITNRRQFLVLWLGTGNSRRKSAETAVFAEYENLCVHWGNRKASA